MSKIIKLAIAGVGTVGKAVVQSLTENHTQLLEKFAVDFQITGISSRSEKNIPNIQWFKNPQDLLANADIIIELMGGEDDPAYSLCKNALLAGKTVITANKALIAKHGNELEKLAQENNSILCYEAAVAGAIPVIASIKESLSFNKIKKIKAILNGTCNYILTEMEEHDADFDATLKKAQDLGYAEADPTLDIGAIDAAHKIAILSSLAYNCQIDFESVAITPLTIITKDIIALAKKANLKIRLVAESESNNDIVSHKVEPIFLAKSHFLSAINGSLNAVKIKTDLAKETLLIGHGAGGEPTASAVLGDLYKAISCNNDVSLHKREIQYAKAQILPPKYVILYKGDSSKLPQDNIIKSVSSPEQDLLIIKEQDKDALISQMDSDKFDIFSLYE